MKKQENKAVSGILNQQQRTEQDNRKTGKKSRFP